MPEETEKDILKKIQGTLTEIRAILALSNEEKLSQAKARLLPQNSLKLQVYNLCDGSQTTQDIANTVTKTRVYHSRYSERPQARGTCSKL